MRAVGLICFTIVITVARGPNETGWVGWWGGWTVWKDDLPQQQRVEQSRERGVEEATAKEPSTRPGP